MRSQLHSGWLCDVAAITFLDKEGGGLGTQNIVKKERQAGVPLL